LTKACSLACYHIDYNVEYAVICSMCRATITGTGYTGNANNTGKQSNLDLGNTQTCLQ